MNSYINSIYEFIQNFMIVNSYATFHDPMNSEMNSCVRKILWNHTWNHGLGSRWLQGTRIRLKRLRFRLKWNLNCIGTTYYSRRGRPGFEPFIGQAVTLQCRVTARDYPSKPMGQPSPPRSCDSNYFMTTAIRVCLGRHLGTRKNALWFGVGWSMKADSFDFRKTYSRRGF